MTPDNDLPRLQELLSLTEEAAQLSVGRSRNDLEVDRMLSLAAVRLLESVGEAAARVSEAGQTDYTCIRWDLIAAMRARLSRAYEAIDQDIVWNILSADLLHVILQLRLLLTLSTDTPLIRSLVDLNPRPSQALCDYSWEIMLRYGDDRAATLPVGLRRLNAIVDFDGGVDNGGLSGHLGNRTDDDGTIQESIQHSLDAFQTFQATAALRIATDAIEEWTSICTSIATGPQLGAESAWERLKVVGDRLDSDWYAQQSAMYAAIDAYIKAHPDEFVHS